MCFLIATQKFHTFIPGAENMEMESLLNNAMQLEPWIYYISMQQYLLIHPKLCSSAHM